MSYIRTKSVHQYYRDIYSASIVISESGAIPQEEIMKYTHDYSTDLFYLHNHILSIDSGLPPERDRALKSLLLAIAMSNLALDIVWHGNQTKLPAPYVDSIRGCLVDAVTRYPNLEYLEITIQLLFRVGDIDNVISFTERNRPYLEKSARTIKIMLMTAVIENDWPNALSLVQKLTSDMTLMGDDRLALLMTVCTIYHCGGIPDSYIDFRSLFSKKMKAPVDPYAVHIRPSGNNKNTTVLICCDPVYYFRHATDLMRSVYHTNRGTLNVHFHIYDVTDNVLTDIHKNSALFPELNISCTSEAIKNAVLIKTAYAARRFVFAESALKLLGTPVLIVDADSLIRKSWTEIQPFIGDSDLLVNRPEFAPFWESVLGGFVWLGGGKQSSGFISRVSLFLRNNFAQNNYPWFIDQVALSAVMLKEEKSRQVKSIPAEYVCDIRHTDSSFSWVVTTVKTGNEKYDGYKSLLSELYASSSGA